MTLLYAVDRKRVLFSTLYVDFIRASFDEGFRVAIIKDGEYHVPTDMDLICAYTMGGEI